MVCSLTRKKQVTVKCIKTNYTDGSRNSHFDDDDEGEETFVNQKGLVSGLKTLKKAHWGQLSSIRRKRPA